MTTRMPILTLVQTGVLGRALTLHRRVYSLIASAALALLPMIGTGTATHSTPDSLPVVVKLSTSSGPTASGAHLTVRGRNFRNVVEILVGGTPDANFKVESPRILDTRLPAHVSATVQIRVVTSAGISPISSADQYSFIAPPAVTAVLPSTVLASQKTVVQVFGDNFRNVRYVTIGRKQTRHFRVESATRLTVEVPLESPGDKPLRVRTTFGFSSLRNTARLTVAQHDAHSRPPSSTATTSTTTSTTSSSPTPIAQGSGTTSTTTSTTTTTTGSLANEPLVGILQPDGTHYQQEHAIGISLVTIPVGWNLAEPIEGTFNESYMQSVLSQIAIAKASGMSVILDPGIQYAPTWVMTLDDSSQFVDQYGDRFGGPPGSGDEVPNAVTDALVRSALQSYLAWLGQQFPTGLLYAIRVGGGPTSELSYPPSTFNGHTDCYWAYDPDTQQQMSVPDWMPGTGTAADAQAFIDQYNANLAAYGAWLNEEIYEDFSGLTQLLMLPAWGQRPGFVQAGVATLLMQGSVELNNGTDWPLQLASIPHPSSTVVYTTWLDAPNEGSTAQLMDPANYLASLVTGTAFRLGGENTGGGSLSNLTLCLARAASLGYLLVNWMQESQLFDPQEYAQQEPSSPPIAPNVFAAAVQQYLG